jgi:hypothetical protein
MERMTAEHECAHQQQPAKRAHAQEQEKAAGTFGAKRDGLH